MSSAGELSPPFSISGPYFACVETNCVGFLAESHNRILATNVLLQCLSSRSPVAGRSRSCPKRKPSTRTRRSSGSPRSLARPARTTPRGSHLRCVPLRGFHSLCVECRGGKCKKSRTSDATDFCNLHGLRPGSHLLQRGRGD